MSRFCTATLLLLPLFATGCTSDIPASALPTTPVIQVYRVPGNASEVVETLNYLTQDMDGRASVLSNDELVVSAPASVHPGVEALVEQMRGLPANAGQRIRLHHWLVAATPAAEANVPETLKPVRKALLDASQATGGLAFERVDYVQQVMRSGASSMVSGDRLGGEVNAVLRQGRVALNLALHSGQRRVGTHIDVDNGETVLLAQVGMTSDEGDMLMFLVRAELF